MNKTALVIAAAAVTSTLSAVNAADATVVRYSIDLDNVEYFFGTASTQPILSVTDSAAAGGLVMDFGWDDLLIHVNDNTGAGAPFANWASELRIGYTWGEYSGIEFSVPFPGANSDGEHGPVSADNQHWIGDVINSDGTIELWAQSVWNDGTGLAAGTLVSGTIWIDVQTTQMPAPGALALLGLAGAAGCRRRRR